MAADILTSLRPPKHARVNFNAAAKEVIGNQRSSYVHWSKARLLTANPIKIPCAVPGANFGESDSESSTDAAGPRIKHRRKYRPSVYRGVGDSKALQHPRHGHGKQRKRNLPNANDQCLEPAEALPTRSVLSPMSTPQHMTPTHPHLPLRVHGLAVVPSCRLAASPCTTTIAVDSATSKASPQFADAFKFGHNNSRVPPGAALFDTGRSRNARRDD